MKVPFVKCGQLAGVDCTVLFSSFRSIVGHTAYFIAVDHSKKVHL
jgi:hypothetical protein